jgi:hypothetical protein
MAQFFPFHPDYSSWEDYNGNLVLYYGQEAIAYNTEDNWQHTAQNIAQTPTFAQFPTPDPMTFNSWQDWAHEFSLIVNSRA